MSKVIKEIIMRAQMMCQSEMEAFYNLHLQIGNGRFPENNGKIYISECPCTICSQTQEFTEHIYPALKVMSIMDPS